MEKTLDFKEYFRRNLPHYQQNERIYFVTTRLYFKFPDELCKLIFDYHTHRKEFLDYDLYLAKIDSPQWLAQNNVSKIVNDTLKYHENLKYILYAYCIMPNHLHILLQPMKGNSLSSIMHSIKSYTAHKMKGIINCGEHFWQNENYDHTIRNTDDFENTLNYIIENPVKAGLVENWEDWKWTFYNAELLSK
jgi:REP element-mobilizing transposase RayT